MKKWKIGDKVKFLNEKGGGIISAIKNEYEVIVSLPDGMEIPYPTNELIPDNKNLILNPASTSLNDIYSVDNKIIYLAIESNHPEVKNANEFYIYLYNLSDYQFYYTYALGKNNVFQCLAHGKIDAFEKQRIKTLSLPILKEADVCQIQMLFFHNALYSTQNPVFETIKLNEKIFSPSNFIQHPEFQKPVFIIILKDKFSNTSSEWTSSHSPQNIRMHLTEEDWEKINQLKEKPFYTSKQKQYPAKPKYTEEMVLDLHIEELVENPAQLTPHQKLQIQMQYFERELHNAIAHHVKKITIIHGVGNGRLKYEVREYLKTIDEIKSVEDAPYKTYGFGATVVYIK
ncbi:MAG: DUF2027 domain-containing protein [Bacteroidetes bacterium]|nr:MAG: DUF2027 domain-containing protein [Bacteroidota bacterium]